MSALMSPTKMRWRSGPKIQVEERRSSAFRWLVWPALLLLAAYLLFCHGCHGDEDNELFVAAHQKSPQERPGGWSKWIDAHVFGTRIGSGKSGI